MDGQHLRSSDFLTGPFALERAALSKSLQLWSAELVHSLVDVSRKAPALIPTRSPSSRGDYCSAQEDGNQGY